MVIKKIINIGHTNGVKEIVNGNFVITKRLNGFNHLLNYRNLSVLPFVPKLISESKETLIFEYIDGMMLKTPNSDDLRALAIILRTLHKSTVNLPKNNLRARIHAYIESANAKGIKNVVINKFWREIHVTLANMRMVNPVHNDVWFENIIKDSHGDLKLVDWEYATMGDKHFDLAFYIESQKLDEVAEQIFLDAYNEVDGEKSYDPVILDRHKRLAHYITICWVYAQDTKPFDTTWMENKLLNWQSRNK